MCAHGCVQVLSEDGAVTGRWELCAALLPPSTCGSEASVQLWQFTFAQQRRLGYFHLEYVPSSAGIQRLSVTISLAKPWSDLLRHKDWHLRVIQPSRVKSRRMNFPERETSLLLILYLLPLRRSHLFPGPALSSCVSVLGKIIDGPRLIFVGCFLCSFTSTARGKEFAMGTRKEDAGLKMRKHEEETAKRDGPSIVWSCFSVFVEISRGETEQKLWEWAECFVHSLVKEKRP